LTNLVNGERGRKHQIDALQQMARASVGRRRGGRARETVEWPTCERKERGSMRDSTRAHGAKVGGGRASNNRSRDETMMISVWVSSGVVGLSNRAEGLLWG